MPFLSVTGQNPGASDKASIPVAFTLVASGLFAWLTVVLLHPRRPSAIEAALWAILWVSVQFVGALMLGSVAASVAEKGPADIRGAFRVAVSAMWFAPIAILLARHSVWLIPAAVCLAVVVGRVWIPEGGALRREPSNRFWEGICFQAGIVAAAAGWIVIAAFCIALTGYRVTRSLSEEAAAVRLPAQMAVAIGLTAIGLLFLPRGNGGAADEGKPVADAKGTNQKDLVSGVILKATRPGHVTIVAPPSPRRSAGRGIAKPLVIPFSGEYWIFHWPQQRPAKSSMVEHGDPHDFKFTAMARLWLRMEAHQTISSPIRMDCCSGIEAQITDKDPMPETVFLELLLRNTGVPTVSGASLGEKNAAGGGKLFFAMPSQAEIQEFNEMVLIYRLTPPRINRSASISVDHFTLIPR